MIFDEYYYLTMFSNFKLYKYKMEVTEIILDSVIAAGFAYAMYYFKFKNQRNVQELPQPPIDEILQLSMKKISKHLPYYQQLIPGEEKDCLIEPYKYILRTGGKKLRLVIAVVLSDLFEKELQPQIVQIGGLIQLLHTASLVIDDIEDQSQKRRDQPCAHLVYGIPNSINAANLMYFSPFNKMMSADHYTNEQKAQLFQIFIQEMLTCHLGQAQDLIIHKLPNTVDQNTLKNLDLPNMGDYFRVTSAKTGSLLRMMVEMVGVVLKIEKKTIDILKEIMTNIGISFQITDDTLNLKQTMGKGILAQDLYQRKFTLIIHYLRDNLQFMQLFLKDKKDKTETDIYRMLEIIKQNQVIQKSTKVANYYATLAIDKIKTVNSNYDKGAFKSLVRFIVERNK